MIQFFQIDVLHTRITYLFSYVHSALLAWGLGGDMYAYTIAGVAYDEASGQVSYLVLDPHFCAPANSATGELSVIHKKVGSTRSRCRTLYNYCSVHALLHCYLVMRSIPQYCSLKDLDKSRSDVQYSFLQHGIA